MRGTVFSRLRLGATKLLRDRRGNALMLTAAAIVPVIGIVGSAIDIGRGYMAQLRLQQACDAGVLAGRRYMSGSTYSDAAKTEASNMFAFNYPAGLYGSQNVAFSSSWVPAGSEVAGTASTRLPAQIMYMFGFDAFNLTANCGAKLEIANVDVMLVLDITTSMTWYPHNDNVAPVASSRLAGLKSGARIFLDTLLSTSSNEGTLRVGMVPYGGAANVGRILKKKNASWISDTVRIPSRTWNKPGAANRYTLEDRDFNVAGVAVGGNTSGFTGINQSGTQSATWGGCVMERYTYTTAVTATTTTIPADAFDLNVNMVPDARDSTKWKLYLPTLAWTRSGTGSSTTTSNNNSIGNTPSSYAQCTTSEAMNLEIMKQGSARNEANISVYGEKIDNLHAVGYTYHDAGMVWGTRLISPNGLFKADNVRTDEQTVGRHIIFMTDGDMNTPRDYYSHQGMEQAIPRIGGSDKNASIARHNNRLKLLCDAAKAEGITIWVIAFSTSVDDYGPLDYCASSGAAYKAPDSATLSTIFTQIAGQISKLRLSK